MADEMTPALPGLGPIQPEASRLERALDQHIRELNDADLMTSESWVWANLVMDLARAIASSAAKGRASGAALATKPLIEAFDRLPVKDGSDFAAIMREAGFAAA
ncbi:hypothetical protein [Arthrobacter sp. RCC_34]|uniref:hypothetical protein n=1 Tax=Arthrobacter sp. RCC_34 TaxID=3239230 RepID=UPI003524AF1F